MRTLGVSTGHRLEEGYFLSSKNIHKFRKILKGISSQEVIDTPYNQTIYFNNENHEVPFNFSVRARRYTREQIKKNLILKTRDIWNLEFKISKPDFPRWREKVTKKLSMEQIHKELKKKTIIPFKTIKQLSPHVAVSYHREHFLIPNCDFRITLDTDLKYFFFNKKWISATKIGEEDITRIELKFSEELFDSNIHAKLISAIKVLGGQRPVSKKHCAYNFEYRYLKSKYKKWPQNTNTEIEAKLSITIDQQDIFSKFKNDFEKNRIKRFGLIKGFTDSWEYTAPGRYVLTKEGKYIRLTKDLKYVTYKSEPIILEDPYGLFCILKRSEIKKKAPKSLLVQPFIERRRSRKTFIIENKISKILYIVLMDRTSIDGIKKELYQFEIEYICSSPSILEEKKIVQDIAYLANYIVRKYKLTPTQQTKYDWVKKMEEIC